MPTITGTDGADFITTSSGETGGDDTINALGGNDYIATSGGFDTINGGAGDDWLDGAYNENARFNVDMGDGSDFVFVTTFLNSSFSMGLGDDWAQFRPRLGVVDTITLGAGRDRIVTSFQDGGTQVFTDFEAGAGGDVLEFSTWFWRNGIWWQDFAALPSSGISNPFGAGRAQLVDSANGALLQVRSTLNDAWTTIATFQGRTAAQFHADNFRGWSPTGELASVSTLNVIEMSAYPLDFMNLFRAPHDTYGDDVIYGTDAGGYISYTHGNDIIYAGAGDDYVITGGVTSGYKVIYLGDGNDLGGVGGGMGHGTGIYGQPTGSTVWGKVYGGAGNDQIGGGWGDDELYGEDGDDRIGSGGGNDFVSGGNGNDRLSGGVGSQRLNGDAGDDELLGGTEDDLLDGGADSDRLFGENGNDSLTGGSGSDLLDGGNGTDTAIYTGLLRSYQTQLNGAAGTVSGGPEGGADTLSSLERVQFQDGVFVFDSNGVAAQVTRLYDTVLQRAPDQVGLDLWVDRIEDQGGSLKEVALGFLNSSEFQAKTGQLSNVEYVEFLYQNALGRASDIGGKSYWVGQLDSGAQDRADLLIGFSESAEHRNLTAGIVSQGYFNTDDDYQAVALLYDTFAGRQPDAQGLIFWAESIEDGTYTLAQVADGFANSPEFQSLIAGMSNAQLVEFMYQNTLGRHSEPAGLSYWTYQLDAGMDHGELLLSFSQSVEHFYLLGTSITNGIDIL